jgi:hypothetical protein
MKECTSISIGFQKSKMRPAAELQYARSRKLLQTETRQTNISTLARSFMLRIRQFVIWCKFCDLSSRIVDAEVH